MVLLMSLDKNRITSSIVICHFFKFQSVENKPKKSAIFINDPEPPPLKPECANRGLGRASLGLRKRNSFVGYIIHRQSNMAEQKQELKYFVRVANTDLDGRKAILEALRKIRGVDVMFSNAVCAMAGVDKALKAGYLNDAQVKKLDEVVTTPGKFGFPAWMFNRRKDKDDGTNKHLITSNLLFTHDNDIKMLKKMRCYRGIRHSMGQPVRGQRTKSNFRKNKGKVLGVKKNPEARSGRM